MKMFGEGGVETQPARMPPRPMQHQERRTVPAMHNLYLDAGNRHQLFTPLAGHTMSPSLLVGYCVRLIIPRQTGGGPLAMRSIRQTGGYCVLQLTLPYWQGN
jgi:hypothetical protein